MERRCDERIQIRMDAACRMPARPWSAKVHDVSRTGLRIEVPGTLVENGCTAIIELPALAPILGQVVWTHGAYAGIRLARPLAGPAAVVLGLDEPPPPEDPALLLPEAAATTVGLLHHWIRRLLKGPSRA